MDKIVLSPAAKKALLLALPLCVFLSIIIVLILFIAPVKNASLQKTVTSVLQSRYGTSYTVGNFVQTKTSLAFFSAVFELETPDASKKYTHAVLVRMTGLSGPICGVFLYAPSLSSEFAGLAGIANAQDTPFKYGATDSLIRFWELKMPVLCAMEEE